MRSASSFHESQRSELLRLNTTLAKSVQNARAEHVKRLWTPLAQVQTSLLGVNENCRDILSHLQTSNDDLAQLSLELTEAANELPKFIKNTLTTAVVDEREGGETGPKAWEYAANQASAFCPHPGLYAKYLKLGFETSDQIEKDIGRTFPNEHFFSDGSGGKSKLRNILHAYNLHDPMHAYVQGVNFIAGHLLLATGGDETRSFWLLVHIMQDNMYSMRELYQPGMPKLKVRCYQLHRLLAERLSALSVHFEQLNVTPHQWFSTWALTIFSGAMPIGGTLTCAWDIFFRAGWPGLFCVSLAVLNQAQQRLLMCDVDECQHFLRTTIWEEVVDIRAAISFAGVKAVVTLKQLDKIELDFLLENAQHGV